MARQGRRLTIGGSGVGVGSDETPIGARGETRRYTPLSESEQAAEAARIKQENIKAAEADTAAGTIGGIIVVESPGGDAPGPSGGSVSGEGTGAPAPGPTADVGPVGGGEPGPSAPGEGDFRRGGHVKESGTVEKGEFVIPKGSVSKMTPRVLEAIRQGKVEIMSHTEAKARFGRKAVRMA